MKTVFYSFVVSMLLVFCVSVKADNGESSNQAVKTIKTEESAMQSSAQKPMPLGNFSVSLAVKDLAESKAFYEKLGFSVVAGDQQQSWLVLQNGDTKIGLFQGMFEANILTFNPGWDSSGTELDSFVDVRELQSLLQAQGVQLATEADEASTGPASFTLSDPDGNQIMIDQHVDKP